MIQTWHWLAFSGAVLLLLFVDMRVLHRKGHKPTMRNALMQSAFWIGLALAFNLFILFWLGRQAAGEYFAGYLLEKSLSVDNLFVFLLIFKRFKITQAEEHRILHWGILGALIMRALFILLGIELLHRFHFLLYVLGGFLLLAGLRMLLPEKEKEYDPADSFWLRLTRKLIPVTATPHGGRFFLRENGKWMATQLFLVLILIEATDLIFAVDSIPAVIAISDHPFIIYTSNIMAILGLRALFFALQDIMGWFHYLSYGLAVVLMFIGAKLMLEPILHITTGTALTVVGGLLLLSILISLFFSPVRAANSERSED